MSRYEIYKLNYADEPLFWIGVTTDLKRRHKEHRRVFGRTVQITVLEIFFGTKKEARYREHCWIERFRKLGYDLKNKTVDRGDGAQTWSPEQRAAIRAKIKGRKESDETRHRKSVSMKGKPHTFTPEGLKRAEKSRIKPGTKPWNTFTPGMTEEEKEAIRERIREGQGDETINRISKASTESNKRTWANYTPEERAERGRRIAEGQRSSALFAEAARKRRYFTH
jgi:hypothetical protein